MKRYEVNGNGTGNFWTESELHEEGDWCTWQDVEPVIEQNERLKSRGIESMQEEIKGLRRILKDVDKYNTTNFAMSRFIKKELEELK